MLANVANTTLTTITELPIPPAKKTDDENVAAALIIILISLVSFGGNGLVLLSYVSCEKIRRVPANWLTFNLALADLLSTIYMQLPGIANLANPASHLQGEACTALATVTWALMTAANWILAAISADRAIAMRRPFQYRSYVTVFRVRTTIILIWVTSFVLALILVKNVSDNYWELKCTPKWNRENIVSAFFASILCFLLPAFTILCSNLLIIHAARKLKSVAPFLLETGQDNSSLFQNTTRTLRSLYVLVVVYLLCSTPYYVAKFSLVRNRKGLFPPSMHVLAITLMFLASALNPFIYAILRKDMRHAYLETLRCLRGFVCGLVHRNRALLHRTVCSHVTLMQQPVEGLNNAQQSTGHRSSFQLSVIPGQVQE